MLGRWRATGCGIPRYHRHRALRRVCVHAVHTHRETLTEIAKVLLQRSFSGFAGLKAIRFPGGLAHCPPTLDAASVIGDDMDNVDLSHTLCPFRKLPCRAEARRCHASTLFFACIV